MSRAAPRSRQPQFRKLIPSTLSSSRVIYARHVNSTPTSSPSLSLSPSQSMHIRDVLSPNNYSPTITEHSAIDISAANNLPRRRGEDANILTHTHTHIYSRSLAYTHRVEDAFRDRLTARGVSINLSAVISPRLPRLLAAWGDQVFVRFSQRASPATFRKAKY